MIVPAKVERQIVIHAKFLGLVLDENLTWSFHIDSISRKIAKSIGILCYHYSISPPALRPLGILRGTMCRCRCRKIAKSIRILYRARHYLNLDTLKNLYCSFIYSHIAFGTLIWGSNYKSKLLPIHFLQKRALRAITFSDRGIPSRPLFQKLDVLYIFEILKLQLSERVAPENNHGKFFYDFPPPQLLGISVPGGILVPPSPMEFPNF